MNKLFLTGELTRDPEFKIKEGSLTNLRTFICIKVLGWKKEAGGRETDIFSCVAFDNQAEFAMKHLKRGMKVLLTGRLHAGEYEDKEGKKIHTIDIIVENIEIFINEKN